jgi:predicted ATPase/DNA-binding CsgD family transcriptional regulator
VIDKADRRGTYLTSFVGREDDLAEGRRMLGAARLVTLVGPGGVGKTRLARRLADEVSRAFPDGTFVVELAEVHDADALATELAAVLGLEGVTHSPEAVVATYVRERRLLLVLDNCEHLVEACAGLVHTLLQESAGLSVVATTRQPLAVAGEQLMNVEPLPLPSPGARPALVTESEAAQLFVDRARLVVPTFEVRADNAELVGRLCTVLDGMPLAIELAAARLRTLSLAQLAERLHDRFGTLSVAATASLARHQTLRASMDWSFDLCSPDEQLIWARMSVFEGGAELEAVEAVCAGPDVPVFEAVAGLVDKSVLVPQEVAGRVRYRMLETIRDYGRERLAQRGESADLAERHRDFFVSFGRSIDLSGFGPRQRDRFAKIAAELPNLRAAHQACLASADTRQGAIVIFSSLWWHWVGSGALDEGLRLADRTLSATVDASSEAVRAFIRASWLAVLGSDRERAQAYAEKALALAAGIDTPGVGASDRSARALLAFLAGDLDHAIDLDRATLGTGVLSGVEEAETLVVIHLRTSLVLAWSGRPAEALADIEKALRLCEAHGDQWWRTYLLSLKGARLADLGRFQEALEAGCQALRLARGFHAFSAVTALELIAEVSADLGEGRRAAVLLGAANAIWPGIGTSLFNEDGSRQAAAERRARGLLGDVGYASAYDRGRTMNVDQAVSFALGDESPTMSVPSPRQASATSRLTAREWDVAELIARGLSNKEIAERLVLSPRTAEGHVTRMLAKLGFTSRAAVAAWVAEQRSQTGSPTGAGRSGD